MCGLAGLLTPGGFEASEGRRIIVTMRDRMLHRGPDDHGIWTDAAAGVAFGFRRLSIMDLSAAGHQPMISTDGRHVLMLNGEVYNHHEIAAEIDAAVGGHPWRGHSDTEILVEAVARWGVDAAIRRAHGMFAVAVWDRRERMLWLARDRIGKKPLFFGWAGNTFLFASELKALREHPEFRGVVSETALSDFMRIGYLPNARCIYRGVSKLPPAHLLCLSAQAAAQRSMPAPAPYWSLGQVALAGLEAQATGQFPDPDSFEVLLRDAVSCRLVSDVPVGAFLSGGIDSSLTTALMTQTASGPVHSFSVGFRISAWDEAPHARAVAAHLHTQHKERYVDAADIRSVAYKLGEICDEPVADDSIIPTTLLCRLAQKHVTVALSGDGGDELFAGYSRYAALERWLARRGALPEFWRAAAGRVASALASPAIFAGFARGGRRLRLLGLLLEDGGAEALHRMVVSQTLDPETLLAVPSHTSHPLDDPDFKLGCSTPTDRMTFMDTASYLVENILAKVDRASMSTSLEVRCPLLDHRIVEMAWRFPSAYKLRDGEGKLPLRAALARHVPRRLTDRPKQGFGAPVEVWLRHELRDWAEHLLSRPALAAHGLLNVQACRTLWERFLRGGGYDRVIWNLLTFQAWYAASQEAYHIPYVSSPAATDAGAVVQHFAPS